MDLKLTGKTQPVFKSVLETKKSENDSINQNRKFSDDTISAHTIALSPSMERISASDGYITNNSTIIQNNISPSNIGSLGAEEGMTSRNLCTRYHMDNLSKYNSKNYKYLQTLPRYLYFSLRNSLLLYIFPFLCFLFCLHSWFHSKAKNQQRIFSVRSRIEKEKREQTEKRNNQKSKRMQKLEGVYGLF